jgi:hypothetical protein
MNKVILATGLVLICLYHSYSQTAQTRSRTSSSGEAAVSANGAGNTVNIAAGTRLAGELQNTIDVRKAKVGDEVVLKTTQAIKAEGRTVVKNGARLIGRVTEVSEKAQANGESRIGILFDRLESGSLEVAIAASIASISKGQANALRNDQATSGIEAGGSSSASARPAASGQQRSSSGNLVGGVAGGVTNSVGGVVNATSTAASDVLSNTAAAVDSTINASGSTAGGVGRSLGRIQISESADASASGGSVLSLRGENLRVEKGTTFMLVLTQAASERTSQ